MVAQTSENSFFHLSRENSGQSRQRPTSSASGNKIKGLQPCWGCVSRKNDWISAGRGLMAFWSWQLLYSLLQIGVSLEHQQSHSHDCSEDQQMTKPPERQNSSGALHKVLCTEKCYQLDCQADSGTVLFLGLCVLLDLCAHSSDSRALLKNNQQWLFNIISTWEKS